MMTKELKRKDKQMQKLEEKMRDIIDKKVGLGRGVDDVDDYKCYENGIDLTSKLRLEFDDSETNKFYSYIPEREFMDLQKKGFEDNHTELLYENDMLRACILLTQSEMNNLMVSFLDHMENSQHQGLKTFDKYRMTKLESMHMQLPKKVNGDRVKQIITRNLTNFKEFMWNVIGGGDQ